MRVARQVSPKRVCQFALLAATLAAVFLTQARDVPRASATLNTKIVLSTSLAQPVTPITSVVLYPSGGPVTLYVWAQNVSDNYGTGSFKVYFTYDNDLLEVTQLSTTTTWLTSTARQADCIPPVWASGPPYVRQIPGAPAGDYEGTIGCHTLDGPPPPFGAQGTGHIATITVAPRNVTAPKTAGLKFNVDNPNPLFTFQTALVDTGGISGGTVVEPSEIPAKVPYMPVYILQCADFTGDGLVDLANDIVGVIQRYGKRVGDPGWNPIYDLNDDGLIDLANDIVGAILQYGRNCTQT